MIYIVLSICCSVTVGILLKLAKRYAINNQQAITFSYLFAIGLSYFFFDPISISLDNAPLGVYIALGILLPLVFFILASSVRNYGIAKTDIAQRLSLFISLMAAWLLFGEMISSMKLAGLITGIVAIVLILNRKPSAEQSGNWIYPLLVFCGFGVIDILFKQLAKFTAIPYTTSLFYIFILAFIIAMIILIYQVIIGKQRFQFINFVCGGVLGCFNFGNILFYLKAHSAFADHPSTVFAAMNIGVIVLGSLVGLFLFKEKLTKLNFAGLGLAIVAVILITCAQLYAL